MTRRPPRATCTATLFPYTTPFRSEARVEHVEPRTDLLQRRPRTGVDLHHAGAADEDHDRQRRARRLLERLAEAAVADAPGEVLADQPAGLQPPDAELDQHVAKVVHLLQRLPALAQRGKTGRDSERARTGQAGELQGVATT